MTYHYKIHQQGQEKDTTHKQAASYTEATDIVLEYSRGAPEADALYMYSPIGSEPGELETLLEYGLERIKAGHPAHLIATNSNKIVWEAFIWNSESE